MKRLTTQGRRELANQPQPKRRRGKNLFFMRQIAKIRKKNAELSARIAKMLEVQ